VSERRITVYAAIAANVAIAITKFIAAGLSGSSALLSEGLHSVIDTGDGLLLLLGIRLSHRPASRRHPYGHAAETYFWSMIVAMCIFGMGGGVSIYEGIHHIIEPHPPRALAWSYATLAIAFVFEGASWLISLRGFRRMRGRRGVWEAIQRSKDPTSFVVVLEDSAALIGLLIAAAGLTLAWLLHAPIYDGMASILIGVLLVATGAILGRETWSLLLGESASSEVVDSIHTIARAQPGVVAARTPRTRHLGPELIHVDIDIQLAPEASGVDASRRIEAAVRQKHPEVQRVSLRFPDEALT